MPLAETLRLVTEHPLNRTCPWVGHGRFLRWQLRSRLAPGGHLVSRVNGVKFNRYQDEESPL